MASKFQTKTIKRLEAKGFFVLNLIKTNKNGIADLLAIKKGYPPLFVEVKEKNDTVKKLQLYRQKEVKKYGAKAIILKDEIR